jgi:hypothetical protein
MSSGGGSPSTLNNMAESDPGGECARFAECEPRSLLLVRVRVKKVRRSMDQLSGLGGVRAASAGSNPLVTSRLEMDCEKPDWGAHQPLFRMDP